LASLIIGSMANDLFSVESRTIVITGGMGQLGACFAIALLERGARVSILDAPDAIDRNEATFGEWSRSDRLACFATDVTRREQLKKSLDATLQVLGEPVGLVTCAAIDAPPGASGRDNQPVESYPESIWRQVIDVNLTGVFLTCQVFGERMAQSGRGSIVNVSSIYGLVSPDQRLYEYRQAQGEEFHKPASYSASKGALPNLGRHLATHWARKGVRVNTLTFGGVYNGQAREFVDGYEKRTPMGRMARPDEYVGAVIFLLSDASSYMTGSDLIVDGGWTSW
jgi:NAD(P)-dependent dehydrogenase (short-subunit alcohol dehydrogenase family)